MSWQSRWRGWGRERAREPLRVDGVLDEDLRSLLEAHGLWEPLQRGELRCAVSGIPLTWENVVGLLGSPEGPRPIARFPGQGCGRPSR